MIINHKLDRRLRRKKGIRKKIRGTPERPRLNVYRSLKHIYAQIIDDTVGRTLVSASSLDKELNLDGKLPKVEISRAVGRLLAQRAMAAGITTVAFDRNGFLYHGRVRALAEGAREGGLQF
ncbi:MAG: 50S ribosomal protein L18 [Bacteroidota bacterium]|nr:50S ribosomal protein L18 [Candidatus Kapabacteria bacterium]MCS7302356.1 50S ribosomal protein L18 [Candidatus Kapabacteria bacterium]MCX7936899.1 50S ribosomal protein L18 [Chlorobiota bacterium]MDW8075322.1 50S ribosomal protein L18 [Bacteroidota bacterium]MDW8271934.1 50S ribosomal protein L18 [Bacteroidota bacterium]